MKPLEALTDYASRVALSHGDEPDAVRFDVFAAAYAWCSLNHGGQVSREYALLCAIPFKPGPLWSETRELESGDNAYASDTAEWLKNGGPWFDSEDS